jgi:subfamily B ATP-binding cassette protein MsbA
MNALRVYRLLWPFIRPYLGRFFVGFALGLVYAGTSAAVVVLVKELLPRVLAGATDRALFGQMLGYAALLPAVFLTRGVCDFFNKYCIAWVGLRSVMELRNRLFEHIHSLSLDFFNRSSVGDLISRITNDAVFVQKAVSGATSDLLKEPFVFLFLLGALFWLDWRLTLASLVLFPLCLYPIAVFGRKARRSTKGSQENLSDLVSQLNESFSGIRIVKAFGMERAEIEQFRKSSKRLFRHFLRVVMAGEILSPITEFVAALGIAAAFIYAYHSRMEVGTFGAIAVALLSLYGPVKKLSKVHVTLQSAGAAIDRIFQVLDVQPTVVEKPGARPLEPVRRQIEFDHVHFRYDSNIVLEDVHFTVPAGKLIAIVGTSGAGKSTLVNLIPRFYDVVDGVIRVDGVDIREVTFDSLRRQVAFVTQEVILFDDTVANNIAIGRPGASRDEIVEAARRANAHEFILQMPHGYDSEIGERGVRLSGGQRQRLAIARAILKNAPILILDEAYSNLDTESERAVQQALDGLMQQRTSFVIAHRLSTVQHADLILVLERGRITERGRHDELLACGGIYKRLYDMQFRE